MLYLSLRVLVAHCTQPLTYRHTPGIYPCTQAVKWFNADPFQPSNCEWIQPQYLNEREEQHDDEHYEEGEHQDDEHHEEGDERRSAGRRRKGEGEGEGEAGQQEHEGENPPSSSLSGPSDQWRPHGKCIFKSTIDGRDPETGEDYRSPCLESSDYLLPPAAFFMHLVNTGTEDTTLDFLSAQRLFQVNVVSQLFTTAFDRNGDSKIDVDELHCFFGAFFIVALLLLTHICL